MAMQHSFFKITNSDRGFCHRYYRYTACPWFIRIRWTIK